MIKSQPVSEVDLVLKYWDCKSETEFQLLTRQLVILAVSVIALAGESPYFPISFVFKGSIPFKKSLIQTWFVSSSRVTPGINRFLQTAVNIQVRRFLMKLFGLLRRPKRSKQLIAKEQNFRSGPIYEWRNLKHSAWSI